MPFFTAADFLCARSPNGRKKLNGFGCYPRVTPYLFLTLACGVLCDDEEDEEDELCDDVLRFARTPVPVEDVEVVEARVVDGCVTGA